MYLTHISVLFTVPLRMEFSENDIRIFWAFISTYLHKQADGNNIWKPQQDSPPARAHNHNNPNQHGWLQSLVGCEVACYAGKSNGSSTTISAGIRFFLYPFAISAGIAKASAKLLTHGIKETTTKCKMLFIF